MLALVCLVPAQASVIPTLNAGSPTGPVAGAFTYSYTAEVSADQTMPTGGFLTLFDIPGLITGSVVAPAGFSVATPNLGGIAPGPPPQGIVDSPALPNVILTRTGAALPGGSTFGFSFQSTAPPGGFVFFNGQATTTQNGQPQANGGQVAGPGGRAIPEPSVTVMLGVAGLLGLGLRSIRRRRAAV